MVILCLLPFMYFTNKLSRSWVRPDIKWELNVVSVFKGLKPSLDAVLEVADSFNNKELHLWGKSRNSLVH